MFAFRIIIPLSICRVLNSKCYKLISGICFLNETTEHKVIQQLIHKCDGFHYCAAFTVQQNRTELTNAFVLVCEQLQH